METPQKKLIASYGLYFYEILQQTKINFFVCFFYSIFAVLNTNNGIPFNKILFIT